MSINTVAKYMDIMQGTLIFLLLINNYISCQGKESNKAKKQLCPSHINCEAEDRCWGECSTRCVSRLDGVDGLPTVPTVVQGNSIQTCLKFVDSYLQKRTTSSSVSFLMTKFYVINPKDVWLGSMSSKLMKKTSVHIDNAVCSWAYDKERTTLFWSTRKGIFKQVVRKNTPKVNLDNKRKVYMLNVFKDHLYYVESHRIIFKRTTSPGPEREEWRRSKDGRIESLSISDTLICCLIRKKIQCWNLLTKTKEMEEKEEALYYSVHVSHNRVIFVYHPRAGDRFHLTLKMFMRDTGQEACRGSMKVTRDLALLNVYGTCVYYKSSTMIRLEAREFGMDCIISNKTLAAKYPTSFGDKKFKYLFF